MIIITGPGRSGTSFLARLYQSLGFDPVPGGGGWEESINGGLEDLEVGRVNLEIIRALRMQSQGSIVADRAKRILDRRPSSKASPGVSPGSASSASVLGELMAWTVGRRIRLQRWGDLAAAAATVGPQLRDLAVDRDVVKDPQFCQTLAVWASSRAPIEQVVISLRETRATAEGLVRVGHLPTWAARNAPNHVAYRVGLLMTAVVDYRLDHVVLRFPDFLHRPDYLYEVLKFPAPVERRVFIEAFGRLVNPDLVHNWR